MATCTNPHTFRIKTNCTVCKTEKEVVIIRKCNATYVNGIKLERKQLKCKKCNNSSNPIFFYCDPGFMSVDVPNKYNNCSLWVTIRNMD